MKRKNLMLTVAAAAVLGAFNPAFAGGGAKHGSAEDMSSPPRAERGQQQGQPGTQSGPAVESAKMNPNASADVNASASTGASIDSSAKSDAATGSTPSSGDEQRQANRQGYEPDRLTGLDQAHPAN